MTMDRNATYNVASPALPRHAVTRKLRALALGTLCAAALGGCIVPFDTGANAAAIALEEMDQAMYSMRDETALLQAQIDSLSRELRKTDSLLRWLANLTGNPVTEPVPLWPLPTQRTDTSPKSR